MSVDFWSLVKGGVVLVSLLIIGSWLPELTPNYIGEFFKKGQGGIIIVDSPEVYSRERMINDRFREVSWLEDELKKSPSRQYGNQAIASQQQTLRIDARLEVGGKGEGNVNPDGNSGDANQTRTTGGPANSSQAESRKGNLTVSVSPSERFRDIRAYREEIRTEMMETLLDDRHDIKGNTLYRLKFDTTVLPQENTEKLAVIQVKLARGDFCEPGATVDGYQESDSEHLPCISIPATHDAWLEQTEEKINAAIDGTINDFLRLKLSTRNFAEMVGFLQARVSETSLSEKNLALQHVDIWDNFKRYHPACEGQIRAKFPRKAFKRSEDVNFNDRVLGIKSCPRQPVSRFFEVNNPDLQDLDRYNQVRKLLLRFYQEHLGDDKLKYYSDFEDIHAKFDDAKFADLKSDLNEENNKWISPLSLQESKRFKFPDKPDSDPKRFIDPDSEPERIIDLAEALIDEARKIVTEAESAERVLLRYAVVAMWIDKYTYTNAVKQQKCEDLYDGKLEVFDPQSLSCLAYLEKTECKDVNYCTVKVEARLPSSRREHICDEESLAKGEAHRWCYVREVFERLLLIDEVYYSYAVTPKESAQRVLTIDSERRQKQLALSLLASSGGALDEATVNSITRAISDSASHLEQIQRKPLILSFGRGQPVIPDNKPTVSDAVKKTMPDQRGIDFGWVIGPKYMFSDRGENKISFYHAPVQNSLSAIISVPSWWTAINLEIDTCWVDQDEMINLRELKRMSNKESKMRNYVIDFCNPDKVKNLHRVDSDYRVRLPGSAEELPRKFGYEIERVPAITDGGVVAEFYVGQKNASLIIQGNELWRSTVVTMGNQKANQIEVLPNMKGIIATFETIESPSKRIELDPGGRSKPPTQCFIQSEILVWTSEGRTQEGQLFARIHANPLLKPKVNSDGSTGYPDGFGDCDRTKAAKKSNS